MTVTSSINIKTAGVPPTYFFHCLMGVGGHCNNNTMSKESNNLKDRRQEFYNSFFTGQEETVEVNGFILVKRWDGNVKDWRVDLFTKESFENYKQAQVNQLF